MAKKTTKKTAEKSIKLSVKKAGFILPHGYEIRKAKRKSK